MIPDHRFINGTFRPRPLCCTFGGSTADERDVRFWSTLPRVIKPTTKSKPYSRIPCVVVPCAKTEHSTHEECHRRLVANRLQSTAAQSAGRPCLAGSPSDKVAGAAHLFRAIVKTCPSSGVVVTCWNLRSGGERTSVL